MKKYILGAVLSLGILVSPVFVNQASAAALTVGQVSAIIGLLQAFGADASVIANVRAALSGSGSTTTGTGTGGGTTGPVTIPSMCLGRTVKYHDQIGSREQPFTNSAYIYKIHTGTGTYQGRLSFAHDNANAISFISKTPCDIAAAADNNLLFSDRYLSQHLMIISNPIYGLQQKWEDVKRQSGATQGYSYGFLDADTDYYVTVLHTQVDFSAYTASNTPVTSAILKTLIGSTPPANGCGQSSTPPYGNISDCYYIHSDSTTLGIGVAIEPLNPWPGLHAAYPAPTGTGTGSGPTASFTINGQTSLTNVDPLMSRTWAWSSTGGSSYNASVVISGCDDAHQNGTTNPWTPWAFGTGTAANGSASPTPGSGYYGCTASATYTVTSSAGQSATARATVAFKHAGTASGYTCPNGQVVTQASQCPVTTNPTAGYVWVQKPAPQTSPLPPGCTTIPTVGSACTVGAVCLSSNPAALYVCESTTPAARLVYFGKIVDGQGAPLSGVKVSVFKLGPSTFLVDALSQADGSWSIDSPYQIAYDAVSVTKAGYEAASGNRFINAGGNQGTWVMSVLGGTMPIISLSPTSGVFNISQSNPATLVFTLSNATRGSLEACYEVVTHPNGSARPGYCDTSANFSAFDGNAEWAWNGSNLIGTFPYTAAQWGAAGIQTKTVFRNKATPAVRTSMTITTTGALNSSSASGTISASPTSCIIPNGTNGCTTYLSWDTAQATAPNVSARDSSSTDNPISSSYAYPGWPYRVTSGTTTFNLKDGSTLLGSVAVTASCAAGSAIIGGSSNCTPL